MRILFVALQICVINLNLVLGDTIEEPILSSLNTGNANSKTCTDFNTSDSETTTNCPSLQNADSLSQTQLIFRLTSPCRYDRFERPCPVPENKCLVEKPTDVYVRLYIYAIKITDANNLDFNIFGFLQLRYFDFRLAFEGYAPNRVQPIYGETQLRERLWVPPILFANEQNSAFLGTDENDILTIVMPNGMLTLSTRIQASLSCWIAVNKFPFNDLQCSAIIESWLYNSSDVLLHWEDAAVDFDQNINSTEYAFQDYWNNETVVQNRKTDLRYSLLGGNYSSISFTVYLTRSSLFYTTSYFLPSIMLVGMSWVSFWLQPDQTPARTTLGTSTMLSLFTLTSYYNREINTLSYPQFFEVWFFSCTFFIFGSLIEFAFVNTIWRRKRCLKLKKVNSKYIFKSTLTPKVISQKNIYDCETDGNIKGFTENNRELQSTKVHEDVARCDDDTWITMTPQETSLWIDRKARFVFPLLFLIFNAIYWAFILCL
ncbi:pH-sensitive chloride channel 2-like [Anastrepha ludens]|uniref:pH-sensitive chloride channel 2-like n=1 Tax=Anastrepha ludens TaxID=28586 RepID=UPI0023B01D66|nr:pH-sensitive chloride channel 2-like [Anastrepha ludens]